MVHLRVRVALMSKPAQMAVAPLIVDYRATPRRVVDFAGYVREYGATVYNVKITDLSLAGCGVECEIDLEPKRKFG